MKIRSCLKTFRAYDLPAGSLHLAGYSTSRDLSDEEYGCASIQKALVRKWVRDVKEKVPVKVVAPAPAKVSKKDTKNEKPVAKTAEPVVKAEPDIGSDS